MHASLPNRYIAYRTRLIGPSSLVLLITPALSFSGEYPLILKGLYKRKSTEKLAALSSCANVTSGLALTALLRD
jgi:hypothetical protein